MPEGPEARTVADKLRPYTLNTILTAITCGPRAKVKGLNDIILPNKVVNVTAYGKKVIIVLADNTYIVVSLGMSGRLQYTATQHSHITFSFAIDEQQVNNIYFTDPRLMGGVEIIANKYVTEYFSNLGPDLLQRSLDEKTWITLDEWLQRYKTQRPSTKAICNMLEDQHRVAGMGWYIITEVLYYSGIHPERQVKTITTDEWNKIRINAHLIIKLSYAHGGFTIKDYISPDGVPGTYPAAIYGKTHDPLGNPVEHKPFKSQRTIHYVADIQK